MAVARLSLFLDRLPRQGVAVVLGLGMAAAVLGVRQLGALEALEFDVYDRLIRQTRATVLTDPRVVLVRVGEEEIRAHGHPLPDALLADALTRLLDQRPLAIGVDLFRDVEVPPGAEALRRVLLGHSQVVLIEKVGGEGSPGVEPPAFLAGSSQVGFADLVRDGDGSLRRGLLMLQGAGSSGLSLSLRLVLKVLGREGIRRPYVPGSGAEPMRLAEVPIRRFRSGDGGYRAGDDAGYQVLLSFRGGPAAFESYSLGQVLEGEVPADALGDKVVILGTAAPSVKDDFNTPFGMAHGMEIHAQLVQQLLDRSLSGAPELRVLSGRAEAGLIALCALVSALLASRVRSPLRFTLWALGGLVAIVFVGAGLFAAWWWVPVAPAALAWMTAGGAAVGYVYFREVADRQRLDELFGSFLDRDVAEAIWGERHAFMDGGRPRPRSAEITVLFCDLSGYTAASEKLDPESLMEWINAFLDAMAQVIGAHGGVVDDYAGDGIKAAFGVPVPRTREDEIDADAVNAVSCALAMGAEMDRLNREWAERGQPRGRTRVGIHTGPAVVGLVGSRDRLKYSSLGDTINTAARLEAHDREGFAVESDASTIRILIGDTTRRRIGSRFACEPVGEVLFKGKTSRVLVHRVCGIVPESGGQESCG